MEPIKKSIKYLIIAFVNLMVLTLLLLFWTDFIELTFNSWVRPIEFLKILGFTGASLIGMRLLVAYFRKQHIDAPIRKIKIASLLTLLISAYLYIDYVPKVIKNRIKNGPTRRTCAEKIKPANNLAHGTKATNLSLEEYREISKTNWFPALPDEASNIDYIHEFNGFLPDYHFSLSYDLPPGIAVEIIHEQRDRFSRDQHFEMISGKKRVTYSEGQH